MADLIIPLGDKAEIALAAHVQTQNDLSDTEYTVVEWVSLHIKELLISDDLIAVSETLQRKIQNDVAVALKRKRNDLIREFD